MKWDKGVHRQHMDCIRPLEGTTLLGQSCGVCPVKDLKTHLQVLRAPPPAPPLVDAERPHVPSSDLDNGDKQTLTLTWYVPCARHGSGALHDKISIFI